jgi:hypothetical protein
MNSNQVSVARSLWLVPLCIDEMKGLHVCLRWDHRRSSHQFDEAEDPFRKAEGAKCDGEMVEVDFKKCQEYRTELSCNRQIFKVINGENILMLALQALWS